jgi:hypothetical protein
MATVNLKRKPRLPKSQNSSPIKLLILKKCSFASSLKFYIVLLIDIKGIYPAAAAGCSSFWADMSALLGAWVLVNVKALRLR